MKKLIAILVSLTMLAALLGACAGNAAEPEQPSASESAASESAAPESQPASEAPAPSAAPSEEAPPAESTAEPSPEAGSGIITGYTELGTPIVDYQYDLPLFSGEDVSYSVWVSMSDRLNDAMPNGFADNVAYQEISKLTGVTLDFVFTTSVSNSEKFNLMIASQDYTDIVTNVSMLWTQGYDYAIDENIFCNLSDMIENDMPVYKALYDQLGEGVKRDLHTDSGNFPILYSLNYDFQERSEGPVIRRDYLEKVGLDMPVTYEDWDKVLHAFQSELGISQPLMLPKGIVHTSNALMSGFNVLGTFSTFPMISEPYYQVDGKVTFGVVEPGFKEYMQMVSDWYKEGIVSSEYMVLNDNPMGSAYIAEITSGNAGIFFGESGQFKNYISAGTATNPDFDIWALPEPVKEAGQTTHFLTAKSPIGGRPANICITTAVDDLHTLGKYLDWFFTPEGSMLAAAGVQGRSWDYAADGTIIRTDEWNNSEISEMDRNIYYAFTSLPYLSPEGLPEQEKSEAQIAAGPIWETDCDSAYVMPTSLSISATETEEYNKVYADIQTYIEENLAKFVTGANPMSDWDSFVQHINEMGLADCIAIKQAALDRYYDRAA